MSTLREEDIRKIAEEVLRQLGQPVSEENVTQIVQAAVAKTESEQTDAVREWKKVQASQKAPKGDRIIVTAFGENRSGILAGLTGTLAQYQCDILDLTQKLMQEFFTVMFLVDISEANADFETVKNALIKKGEELNLKVIIQHEAIFNAMHRI
jgi:ACT domain-containing protein